MWSNWFTTPSVLFVGGLLVAAPIILHLVMRRKPKHLEFPALRLIKRRNDASRRRLQLRHLLLLLLRCLAVALAAAALARPSVPSAVLGNSVVAALLGGLFLLTGLAAAFSFYQKKSPWLSGSFGAAAAGLLIAMIVMLVVTLSRGAKFRLGADETPVAAVLVFDTSPRMQYSQNKQTRLDKARDFAGWLLEELPRDSDVAVLDLRDNPASFSSTTARDDVAALETTNTPLSLVDRIAEAVRLSADSDKQHKEIYVFTDMTGQAWQDDAQSLQRLLAQQTDAQVYVIDVGAENPKNLALKTLDLSTQTLASDSNFDIRTTLESTNVAGTHTVELYLEQPGYPSMLNDKLVLPKARLRDQKVIDNLKPGGARSIEFRLRLEQVGIHHGYLKIKDQDDLPVDDERHFTVQVQNAWPVLVAAPDGVRPDHLLNVLEPYEQKLRGTAKYVCDVVSPSELVSRRLDRYAVVCLLDPPPMTPAIWDNLADYVEGGGGLAVFLGRNARQTNAFNQPSAQKVLPGPLNKVFRAGGDDLFLSPQHYDHPALAAFRPVATTVPWRNFPVYRFWSFGQLADGASVVLRYGNNRPALLERSVENGRVLTLSTPITDDNRQRDPQSWNDLPSGENAWPYLVLTTEMMKYLVAAGDAQLNYLAGQTAKLNSHPNRDPEKYALYAAKQQLDPVSAVDGRVTIRNTSLLGAYRLKGQRVGDPNVTVRGFSINLPDSFSDLTRESPQRLQEVLGKDRFQYVRNQQELHRQQRKSRRGFEFFPYLLVILAATLGLEHLLANRFYRKDE